VCGGVWGFGGWARGPPPHPPTPQPPTPNPQSPIPNPHFILFLNLFIIKMDENTYKSLFYLLIN